MSGTSGGSRRKSHQTLIQCAGDRPGKRSFAPIRPGNASSVEVTPNRAELPTGQKSSTVKRSLRIVALVIALFAIFVGGASAHDRFDGANLKFAEEFAELK